MFRNNHKKSLRCIPSTECLTEVTIVMCARRPNVTTVVCGSIVLKMLPVKMNLSTGARLFTDMVYNVSHVLKYRNKDLISWWFRISPLPLSLSLSLSIYLSIYLSISVYLSLRKEKFVSI